MWTLGLTTKTIHHRDLIAITTRNRALGTERNLGGRTLVSMVDHFVIGIRIVFIELEIKTVL